MEIDSQERSVLKAVLDARFDGGRRDDASKFIAPNSGVLGIYSRICVAKHFQGQGEFASPEKEIMLCTSTTDRRFGGAHSFGKVKRVTRPERVMSKERFIDVPLFKLHLRVA
jgi:hypothetical protein